VASLSQGRTAAAQCGLFTYKSVPVIFEPPCIFKEPVHHTHNYGHRPSAFLQSFYPSICTLIIITQLSFFFNFYFSTLHNIPVSVILVITANQCSRFSFNMINKICVPLSSLNFSFRNVSLVISPVVVKTKKSHRYYQC